MAAKAPQHLTMSNAELEWIKIRDESEAVVMETNKDKFIRKVKENPLVPIGALATAGALGFGLYNFRIGNRRMSQMMMRTRIAAQGFTVAAIIVGVLVARTKKE